MNESRANRCRVLLVGSTDVQSTLEASLSRRFETVSIRTAETAMAGLEELAGVAAVDCVVSGGTLPDGDGLTLFERVRERVDDLPFVLYPTTDDEELVADALAAGVTDYVPQSTAAAPRLLASRVADAVEHRRRKRRVDSQRRRTSTVAEAAHGGIVTIDADGTFLSASERATEILGLSESELADRTVEDTGWWVTDLDGEPIPDDELPFARVVDSGEPVRNRRIVVEMPDGGRRYLSVNAVPEFSDGALTEVVVALTDITAQVHREETLEQSRSRLRALFDEAADPVFVVDELGTIVDVSEQAVERLGYDRSALVGNSIWSVETGYDRLELLELIDEVPPDEPVTVEGRHRRADGSEFPVEVRINRVTVDDEPRFVCQVRDRSGQRSTRERLEREIREKNRNLETLLRNIRTILFEIDGSGEFVRVRGQGIDAVDVGPDFFEGRSAFDVFEEYPAISANVERALAGERTHDVFEFEGVVFETWYEPVVVDGTVERVVGTAIDVTERQAHERTLSALHDVTRDLLGATTTRDVASVVFDGATDILELETVAVLCYDEDEDGLVPVEWSAGIERATGGVPSVWPRDGDAWTAFQQGALVSRSELGAESPVFEQSGRHGAGSFLPLGEYGVLIVGDTDADALGDGALDLADTLAATAEAAMARVDREQMLQERESELREEKAFVDGLVDSVPDVMFAVDEDGQFLRWNDRLLSATGYSAAELTRREPADLVPADQRPTVKDQFEQVLGGATVRTEVDLVTASGEQLPYEFTTAPIERDGGVEGVIGIGRDVSTRREHERTLTALHDVTRDLLRTESNSVIGDRVVTAAEDALDFDAVGVFTFDDTDNVLRPIAYSERTQELVGEVPTFGPGEGIAWEVFVEGEGRLYDDVRADPDVYNPETPFRTELFVPLGEHGVLVAGNTTLGAVEDRTVELAQILAANCEAALTRTERERSLRERDRELQEQNARLERLNEINEKIRTIDHELVGVETRPEIESIVCERLAAVDRVSFAWVGSLDPVTDAVVPEAWDGQERGYLDSVPTELSASEPAVRAARTGESVVVDSVGENLRREPWRSEALSRDFLSVAAVPLVYDGVTYGVVTVYAERPDAFTEMAEGVLAELGGTVAHAINAVERKQALLADSQVELEFELPTGSTAMAELVAELDCDLAVDSVLPQPDGTALVYATVEGVAIDAVTDAASGFVTIDSVREIGTSAEGLGLELRLTGESIVATVAEHGGRLEGMRVEDGRVRVVASLPETADARSFIDMFGDHYAGAELYARRRRTTDEPADSRPGSLFEALTPRQTEALQVAYYSGFFEWPRESTGEELAETLDVSPPTFLEHLRRAEAKLVDSVVETEPVPKPHDD